MMKKTRLATVLMLMLALAGFTYAAVVSNPAAETVYLEAPISITQEQTLPATIYKTNSYVTVYKATNNTPDSIQGYGNLEVLKDGSAYDGTGLTAKVYVVNPFYDGKTLYTTVEDYIDSGDAFEGTWVFDAATGAYKTGPGGFPSGLDIYAAVKCTFGMDMPSANYTFSMWVSDN